MITWMGLKFEDQADLDRARADLGERLNRITEAERRAFLDRCFRRVLEQHAGAFDELGKR